MPTTPPLRFPEPSRSGMVDGARASRKEDEMSFPRRQLLRILSYAFGSGFILSWHKLGIAAQTATQPIVSPAPAGKAVTHGLAEGTKMEKVI